MRYLGIDAGASATQWALVDDEKVLLSGVAGPIDGHIQRSESLDRMRSTLAEIYSASGGDISRVLIGITGIADNHAERNQTIDVIGKVFTDATIELEGDIHLAYRVHFQNSRGVLLYAGTGAVACTNIDGKLRRVGGWGYLLGDEGAGYWIGREAIRLLMLYVDRDATVPAGSLESEIAYAIGGADWGNIKNFVYGKNRSEIASLARIVFQYKDQEGAIGILTQAADHLADLVGRVDEITGDSSLAVLFTGGTSQGEGALKDRLVQRLGDRVKVSNKNIAEGAAILARGASSRG
jgi:N-acetylglucosamine kinase-like BadF-type ATPase